MSGTSQWRPNWEAIGLVIRKDMTAVRRSKSITLPMILVPVILIVVLPLSVGLLARNAPTEQIDNALSSPFVRDLVRPILELPERERLVVLVLGYLLSPLLLVIPLMVSAVLAADAFAGEKERRTLESLLHLPIADRDLFLAKVLGAFLPAVVITWVGSILYVLLCNAIAWPVLRPTVPSLRTVHGDDPVGVARSRGPGARAARHRLVACEDDARGEPARRCRHPAADLHRRRPGVGLAARARAGCGRRRSADLGDLADARSS